jgi:hypothetical protein
MQSVSEKAAAEKRQSTRWAGYTVARRVLALGMDKKEINSTKMTLNFLVWIGGVFMLLLFALLAHFVWRLF